MEVKAYLKGARMSPHKLRLVRRTVVGLPVAEARAQLTWQVGKAAHLVLGVLNSAVANAKQNFAAEEKNLKVRDVVIGAGLTFKRFRPVSRGMAHAYVRRTANLTVVVSGETAAGEVREPVGANITTLTADEYVRAAPALELKESGQPAPRGIKNPPGGRSATEEAYQLTKMQQQGGDRQKTHRRKSG